MKKITVLLSIALVFVFQNIFAQSKSSTINQVTVFTNGAQIDRSIKINYEKGRHDLLLNGLSSHINSESIRVTGNSDFVILNVQFEKDYVSQVETNDQIESIQQKIDGLKSQLEEERVKLKITEDKLDFLKSNKEISSKDITSTTFQNYNAYYGQQLETLSLQQLKQKRSINKKNEELGKLQRQLRDISNNNEVSGVIKVSYEAKQSGNMDLKFSYRVKRASWYPSYDLRYNGADKPMSITYKAIITQTTDVDWKDVHLVLSTAKQHVSGTMPYLDPFYVNYTPKYEEKGDWGYADGWGGSADDMATEELTMAAAPELKKSIRIRGTNSTSAQEPMYIVDGEVKNDIDYLDKNSIESLEVLKDASSTAIYGSRGANGVVIVNTKGNGNGAYRTISAQNETASEFVLANKHTIQSDYRSKTLMYKQKEVPASFTYQAVPKLSEHVYLVGQLTDWSKYNLISGQASIYMDNAYVGKTRIKTDNLTDTLDISFGVDNNISIKREKLSEYEESKAIGSNKRETIAYKITVRNNKNYEIEASIFDQIPVSQKKEIQVELIDISNAVQETDTGKLSWKIKLKPNEVKEIIVRYAVKYPKSNNVILE
ncbi:mucoidy inhibitor MuiA family protein [Flammeovirga sp. SubArs3]|uniref:mucoidy inhibitor MuiA family protein n=1 Tax=Flammeovirga sp. SubArs3 TaxID=2995316 RepID=UPI00248C22B9|nr:mucoidy inhibitor MuiA family protein [Flammeovirga sp. SubArs3]